MRTSEKMQDELVRVAGTLGQLASGIVVPGSGYSPVQGAAGGARSTIQRKFTVTRKRVKLTPAERLPQRKKLKKATLQPNSLSSVVEDEDEEIGGDDLTLDESCYLCLESSCQESFRIQRDCDIHWGLVHRRKVDSTYLNLEKSGPLMGVVAKALTGSHSGRA